MKIGDLLIRLGVDDAQFRTALSGAEKKAQSSGNFIANAFSTAIGMGMAQAGAAVSNAVIGIAKSFVTLNASMEQTRIAYTTLLGSRGAADAFINSMEKFAAVTPFAFEDVDKAAKRFLAFGIEADRVIPILTSVGDAAAALGLGGEGIDRITLALGQMSIKAHLSGEEVRQLNEAGIGAQKYLTEAFGLTADAFDDLSATGISGVQGMNAIIQGLANDKKFVGMMAAQATTATGIWSTAKDNLIIIARQMGEGMFNQCKLGLQGLSGYIEQFSSNLTNGGIVQALANLIPLELVSIVMRIGEAFQNVLPAIMSFAKSLQPIFEVLVGLIGEALVFALNTVTVVLGGLAKSGFWSAIVNAIGFIVGLVYKLVAGLNWLGEQLGIVEKKGYGAAEGINSATDASGKAIPSARENTRAQELQADGYDKVASSAIAAAEAQLESAKAGLQASMSAGGNTGAIGSYIASVAAMNNKIKGLQGAGGKRTTASNVTSGSGGGSVGADSSRASTSGVDSEKAAADEKARIRENLTNKLIKLSMDEFDYQRYLLYQEVDECRKAGYDETKLAEYAKTEINRINDEQSDYTIKTTQDTLKKAQELEDAANENKVKALDVERQKVELGGELNNVNKENLDTQLKLMDVDKWQLEMIKQYPTLIDLINQVGAARKAIIQHVPEEQTLWQAFTDGIRQTTSEWGNAAQQWVDIGKTTASSLQSGFSDIFFDGMQGDLKSFGDYWGSFCKSVMRTFTDMISKMLVEYLTKSAIAKAFGGLLGGMSGASGGGVAYTGQTGPVRADGSFATGLDYVPRDNFVANLHKGEMVLTRTDAEEYRSGVNSAAVENPVQETNIDNSFVAAIKGFVSNLADRISSLQMPVFELGDMQPAKASPVQATTADGEENYTNSYERRDNYGSNLPASLAEIIRNSDSGGGKESSSVIVNIYNQTDSKVESKMSTDSLGRTVMSLFLSEYSKNTGNVQGLLKGAR